MLIALLVSFLGPSNVTIAMPWWADGHRIVCRIAWTYMLPTSREAVNHIIGGGGGDGFSDSCVWADRVRPGRNRYDRFDTAHYLNIPAGSSGFDEDRDCTSGICIVQAIRENSAILSQQDVSSTDRRDALRFLSHFVADLHQPLHAGYASDRGGNQSPVPEGVPRGNGVRNLHSFWDSQLSGSDWRSTADSLVTLIRPEDIALWRNSRPAHWADESFQVVEDFVYQDLDAEIYLRTSREIAARRMQQAGVRLAHLLNELLAD